MRSKPAVGNQLSATQLAPYLGCMGKITGDGATYQCISISVGDAILGEVTIRVPDGMAGVDIRHFKPILRPTHDATEAEARQLLQLNDPEKHIVGDAWYPNEYQWLQARYFDVLGWIDGGLAIDATALESNPYRQT